MTKEIAHQFAQMLLAGVPAKDAVRYFYPEDTDDDTLRRAANTWPRKQEVAREITLLQGGATWLDMSLEERIKLALDKKYNEMAWLCYTENYADAEGSKKQKLDTAREVLEKKLAGTAGQMDPLAKLYEDILAGKVKAISKPVNLPTA